MVKKLLKTVIISLSVIMIMSYYSCSSSKPSEITQRGIQINIEVTGEDGNLPGATLSIDYADGNSEPKVTNSDGLTTLYNVHSFPLNIHVDNGKSYIPKDVRITKDDIEDKREIRIVLDTRKTIIWGRVIDIDTGEPIPKSAGPVTITTDPPTEIEQASVSGEYRIESSEFDVGTSYTVKASLSGKYEENKKLVEITNHWGENMVPTIGLKKLLDWKPPPPGDEEDIKGPGSTASGS